MTPLDDPPIVAYEIEGSTYPRLRVGEDWKGDDGVDRCGDCGEPFGELHQPGCDIERCPRCRLQFLTCGCRDIALLRTHVDLEHTLTIGVEGEKVSNPTWELVRSEIDNLSTNLNSALMLSRGNWFYVEANGAPDVDYYLHVYEGSELSPRIIAGKGITKEEVVEIFRRFYHGDLSYRDVVEWQPEPGIRGCLIALGLILIGAILVTWKVCSV